MSRCKLGWMGLLAAICCTCLVGCGGGSGDVAAKGQLLVGGQPATLENYDEEESYYRLEFYLLDEAGGLAQTGAETPRADVDESGNFTVQGREGKGIPPGKYRVAVYKMGEAGDDVDDLWRGKYNMENSTITVEVTGAPLSIDVPLKSE